MLQYGNAEKNTVQDSLPREGMVHAMMSFCFQLCTVRSSERCGSPLSLHSLQKQPISWREYPNSPIQSLWRLPRLRGRTGRNRKLICSIKCTIPSLSLPIAIISPKRGYYGKIVAEAHYTIPLWMPLLWQSSSGFISWITGRTYQCAELFFQFFHPPPYSFSR